MLLTPKKNVKAKEKVVLTMLARFSFENVEMMRKRSMVSFCIFLFVAILYRDVGHTIWVSDPSILFFGGLHNLFYLS